MGTIWPYGHFLPDGDELDKRCIYEELLSAQIVYYLKLKKY